MQDDKNERIQNVLAEAELRLTGGGWVQSVRKGLAAIKHAGKALPTDSHSKDPGE